MTLELVRALNELAAERARTGRLDEAERALLEALALRPDSPELRDNLAALRSVRLR
jgi:Flp pilus assembly protein TadD